MSDDFDLAPEGAEVPAGYPAIAGEGENICSTCGGSGEQDGKTCPECGGRGLVVEQIAGG
jgi:DnaJ-class molecular chaperone